MRRGGWIQTASGRQFWPLDARAEEVAIEDIAHALSHMCRYGGHCRRFYSVAEHSVLLARAVSPENRLRALLHDASEAYLVDVPRPIKPFFFGYEGAEERLQAVIYERFGLSGDMPEEIGRADFAILSDEFSQNMEALAAPWPERPRALGVTLQYWTPDQAKAGFLAAFDEITGNTSSPRPLTEPRAAGDGRAREAEAQPPSSSFCAPGFTIVPAEPTEEMLVAGLNEDNPIGGLVDWRGEDMATRSDLSRIYRAMLAAAPAAPAPEPLGPLISFDVREPYYLASCDHCGWVGSSEHCGTDQVGDDSDCCCPRCYASGADCGKVASRIAAPPAPVAASGPHADDLAVGRFDFAMKAKLERKLSSAAPAAEDAVAAVTAAGSRDLGAMADAMIAAMPDPVFPRAARKDGRRPCPECHLQAGEACDICGGGAAPATGGQP